MPHQVGFKPCSLKNALFVPVLVSYDSSRRSVPAGGGRAESAPFLSANKPRWSSGETVAVTVATTATARTEAGVSHSALLHARFTNPPLLLFPGRIPPPWDLRRTRPRPTDRVFIYLFCSPPRGPLHLVSSSSYSSSSSRTACQQPTAFSSTHNRAPDCLA